MTATTFLLTPLAPSDRPPCPTHTGATAARPGPPTHTHSLPEGAHGPSYHLRASRTTVTPSLSPDQWGHQNHP